MLWFPVTSNNAASVTSLEIAVTDGSLVTCDLVKDKEGFDRQKLSHCIPGSILH
jgi:hypothetical protein